MATQAPSDNLPLADVLCAANGLAAAGCTVIKRLKLKNKCATVAPYGNPLEIGNRSGDCYLDDGKPLEDARQTESANYL